MFARNFHAQNHCVIQVVAGGTSGNAKIRKDGKTTKVVNYRLMAHYLY